ncbi:MAG: hypothetical protein LBR45_05395 [Bacteroidales bacterium]|jgi:hypothetical protein|nr:hypothetical protein [Bacteroidales bacterium]
MKKTIYKLIVVPLLLIVIAVTASCGDENSYAGKLTLNNVKYSLCNTQSKTLNTLKENYIKFTAIDDKTLRIEQGLTINCCCDSITANLSQTEQNIVVDVYDYGNDCNCVCLGTIAYEVSCLQTNSTYTFTFKQSNNVIYTASIKFHTQLNQTISLNEEISLIGEWEWEKTYLMTSLNDSNPQTPENTGITEFVIFTEDSAWSKIKNGVVIESGEKFTVGHGLYEPTNERYDTVLYIKNGTHVSSDCFVVDKNILIFYRDYAGRVGGGSKWFKRKN